MSNDDRIEIDTVLHDDINRNEALALWDAAFAAQWHGPAVCMVMSLQKT